MNNLLRSPLIGIVLLASCAGITAMDQNQDAQADKGAEYHNAIAGLQALNEKLKANALYEEKHCNDIALIHASSRGHTKVVSKLIEGGADVNYRSKEGILTPLIAAAEGVVPEDTCRLLIQAGCRVNDSNRDGVTALHIAAKNKYLHTGHIDLLLHAKANLNQTCNQGKTALCYASSNFGTTCFFLKHLLRVTVEEIDSVKNWLLLTIKLRNDLKINIPQDIRRSIAHSICRSLAQDLRTNIMQAGGAKALELAQEEVRRHVKLRSKYGATFPDSKLMEQISLTKELEDCLDLDKLTEFVHKITLLPKRAESEREEEKPKGWKCIVM